MEEQRTLEAERTSEKIEIYADHRESPSGIPAILESRGAIVRMAQLELGDYVLSDRVICERKTRRDFISSIIDGRLFEQASRLAEKVERPLIIIEGEAFPEAGISRKALDGAIAALILDFDIPVFFTRNASRTAEILLAFARREQLAAKRPVRLQAGRKPASLAEQQLFIVESIPMIGPQAARALLEHFGSVEAISTASRQQLQEVEGIGEQKARTIKRVLTERFAPEAKPEH